MAALPNPSSSGLTASPSCSTEPSHIPGVGSMESLIDDLTQLATAIPQDRDIHVHIKDVLLNAHVVGNGFVDDLRGSDKADVEEKTNVDVEPSLFIGDDSASDIDMNEDTEYVDDGGKEREDLEQDNGEEASCEEIVGWLNNLGDQIISLHHIPTAGKPTPCPHLAIEPKAYQYTALAKIEHNRASLLKAVLLGDPPGLGKTLPSMMAVVKAISTAKRFSIVVVPSSCSDQWKSEFAKFFLPDTVRVFVLRDPNTSPLELIKYDVILVSYSFVMSQYRKLCNYVDGIAEFKHNNSGRHLERPNLSIFSDIFYAQENITSPYLVLDEVTAVKNAGGITFAAIEKLRSLADMCIMITGSPIDNTWIDQFAYLQFVQGHEIKTRREMLSVFASRNASGQLKPPRGNKFRRLIQLLNSFVIRRPEDTIDLPVLHKQTIIFRLSPKEQEDSDFHFQKYMKVVQMNSKDAVQLSGSGQRLPPWKHLTSAMQHAMHPAMVLIMHLARDSLANGNDPSADVLYEAEDIKKWTAWREELKKEDNWKSSRIMALIDILNERRDIDPACSILLFDESVYFLDIVQIAFEKMYDPVDCLRFDGRETPEKRTVILQNFEKAAGAKVLLISRAAGGVGLNIPAANVVILCGPWWKSEWEGQAIKRAHRPGQTREVHAIRLKAENCALEDYKAGVRDKKNKHNSQIVLSITRKDGVVPKVWDDLE
ncbi:hypothetical protein MMC27_005100 [Xylographa pallens]|nr:hypothetical protein [Xylographa pallens]